MKMTATGGHTVAPEEPATMEAEWSDAEQGPAA